MFHRNFIQAMLGALLIAQSGLAHAVTLTVTELDDSGPGTLRAAIENANPGDTIIFQVPLPGTITLESPLPALNLDLTIQGPGADLITVSGAGAHQVFYIDTEVVISVSGLSITQGAADFGGAIENLGQLSLSDCVISNSLAEFDGGAISNEGALEITDCTLSDNLAGESGFGGGIDNFGGTVVIRDSVLSGNSAGAPGVGGGINNGGGMTIIGSTLSNNTAGSGGGIENSGDLIVLNGSISGNSAEDLGGGIDNFGEVVLVFSIIADNSADFGGGIANDGDFLARNSLVANNPTGGDCDDASISFQATGNNLATDDTCPGFTEVDSGALALGPLADNGGPTLTHALGEGSVAVDAASDCTDDKGAAVETDQRGVSRPQGADCDVGAFELEAVGDPEVSLDPDSVNFGNVGVGSGSPLVTVTVENTGGGDLEIGTLSVSGPNAAKFGVFNDDCSDQIVAPGATCTFQVGFTPWVEGERNAQVNIPSNADSTPNTLPLTGFGVETAEPQVSLDPEQLDFGDIDLIGQPSQALQVTVTNTGSGDLDIGTLTIQGSQAGDFDFGGDVCSGQIVAPDANCTFEVIFTPQAAGIRRAWVSIPSNAPGSPHRVDLLGTQDVIFFDDFESDQ